MILNFNKPQKVRTSADHNNMFQSDSGVAGTYVSNMSDNDKRKFKAKHIKGDHERIEIRVEMNSANILVKVFKKANNSNEWKHGQDNHNEIQFSTNGKIDISLRKWEKLNQAIEEAKQILGI